MITVKKYKCLVCGNVEDHSTNHYGDIYCQCKKCKNGQLSCMEGKERTGETLPTNLHYYRFDVSNEAEKLQYLALKKELQNKGLVCFNVWDAHSREYWEVIKNTSIVNLHTDYIFDNQWNSNISRVHDWYQAVYPNKKIKQGYWLELTHYHTQLRQPKIYNVTTIYKGEVLGKDQFTGINTSEVSNEAYGKYFKEGMDIWQYETKIELAY